MRRAAVLIFLLFAGVFAVIGAPPTKVGEWTLFKVQGRDYITLDNVAEFYGFDGVRRVGNNDFQLRSGNRSLRGRENSQEFFINNLKFILSYPVVEHNGKLCLSRMDLTKIVEPVMRPSRIRNAEAVNTVVLDPGHGGHDNGAYSQYGYEKQFTLDVCQRARILLMQGGWNVQMTRTTDKFVALHDRTRFANQFENALFVSVHFNHGGAGTGVETFTLAPRGVPSMMADGPRVSDLDPCPGNIRDAENMALATATHAALVVRTKMFDRGIKRARFVVIRDITIPGVLVEGGFLSNSHDAKLIATPAYRQTMAQAIFQAVNNYRRAVGPAAPPTYTAEGPRVETNGVRR